MRPRTVLCLVLPAAFACSGTDPAPTETKPEFAEICTTLPTLTAPGAISIPTQSTGTSGFWALKNNCATTSSGPWDFRATRTGAVVSVNIPSPSWVTLAGGVTAKIGVGFTTGTSTGTGTVTLTATRDSPSPVTTISKTQTVTVTAGATGIPYGLYGINPDTLARGTIWTATVRTSISGSVIKNLLMDADAKGVGVWVSMVKDDQFYKNTDGSFNLNKWKADFDATAGTINTNGTSEWYDDYVPYIGKALQATLLLDDLANFNPDVSYTDVEAMAAHSKQRYPTLLTAVRDRTTSLQSRAPVCTTCPGGHRPHANLDMGWAQYRSDRGDPGAYRDAEIRAAKDMHLGLVIGINIRKGNITPDGPVPVSTDDILEWGAELLEPGTSASDYACAFIMWDDDYVGLGNPVFTTLSNKAKNHVRSPCKYH